MGERAAMNPDHHWQPGPTWIRRPYIEVQTVLTGDGRLRQKAIERWEIRWLGDGRAIGERVAHAIQFLDRLRRLKASRPERGCCVGDACEDGTHSHRGPALCSQL